METVRLVIHDDPVPPSRLVPRLARDLETICLKCLNKDPQKRYATAEELADDLDRYREGKPIKARPTHVVGARVQVVEAASGRRPVPGRRHLLAFIGLTAGVIGYQRYDRLQEDRRNAWVLQQNEPRNGAARPGRQGQHPGRASESSGRSGHVSSRRQGASLDSSRSHCASKRSRSGWTTGFKSSARATAAEQRDRVDRERFQKFLDLSQDAQLSAAGFGVLDETDRLEKLRASAHAALATYAQDPEAADDAWTLAEPLPAALSETEKARVADDCYDLLLILSQAAEPAEGLRILDRAVRLRPKTTAAYHRRRAECLERAGDLAGRDRENREASRIDPVTRAGLLPERSRAGPPPPVRRRRSSPQLGPASRSREDLGPPPAGGLLPQHATEGVEPGQDQPDHVHPEPSRPGGPLPDACPRRRGGGQPGPREDRPVAPR